MTQARVCNRISYIWSGFIDCHSILGRLMNTCIFGFVEGTGDQKIGPALNQVL